MLQHKTFKGATIFSVSALALAISSAANAYEFEVNDTKVVIGGYAKLDLIYDVDDELGNSVKHTNISLDDEDHSEGHTDLHAFQSRIGFQTATPVSGSVLKTNIEGDFYGSGGGSFRLRHAYGEWNGILAGQTWTNFGSSLGTTPTIDFTGQGGQANTARQPQLRYTTGGFSVALEDPDNLGGVTDASMGEPKSQLPDLTLRYLDSAGAVDYSASAVLRQLQVYSQATDDEESAFGWGVALEAAVKATDAVTFRGAVTHGDGLGGYLNVSPSNSATAPGAPAYVDPTTGDLETVKGTGGTVGMSLAAGPGAFNVSYSVASVDLDDAFEAGAASGTADETYESIYVNYIWSPVKNVTYGIEAGHHSREVVNGDDGDAVRIQGMVMYRF